MVLFFVEHKIDFYKLLTKKRCHFMMFKMQQKKRKSGKERRTKNMGSNESVFCQKILYKNTLTRGKLLWGVGEGGVAYEYTNKSTDCKHAEA